LVELIDLFTAHRLAPHDDALTDARAPLHSACDMGIRVGARRRRELGARRALLRVAVTLGPTLVAPWRAVVARADDGLPDAPGPGPRPAPDGVLLRLTLVPGQTFRYAFTFRLSDPSAATPSPVDTTVQAVYAYTVSEVLDDGTALVAATVEHLDVTRAGVPPGGARPPPPGPVGQTQTYQARVTVAGVAVPVGPELNYVAGGGGSGHVNGFPFVGALTGLGYPGAALAPGTPVVRERQLDDPPLPPTLATPGPPGPTLPVQVAPGHERSEVTLLGVDGQGGETVARVVERLTGSSQTRRRASGAEYGGTFDVAAEYDVLLATGLTRQARITSRVQDAHAGPASPPPTPPAAPVASPSTTAEYRLLDATARPTP
jgi:hypothetical protein